MRSELSYLLAHGKQQQSLNCPFVTFTPAELPAEAFVGIYDGFFAYDPGGECEPEFILRTPGLIRRLRELELAWFLPLIERLAAGKAVSLDEVQDGFRKQTGREMETSKRPYRFAFMSARIPTE